MPRIALQANRTSRLVGVLRAAVGSPDVGFVVDMAWHPNLAESLILDPDRQSDLLRAGLV
jgi:hypothetical protein